MCQKLIQILYQGILKMMGYCNQVWNFEEPWKQSALRIKLGWNQETMDDKKERLKMAKLFPCDQVTLNHCCGKWDLSKKKGKSETKNVKQCCHNYSGCDKKTRVYRRCNKGILL